MSCDRLQTEVQTRAQVEPTLCFLWYVAATYPLREAVAQRRLNRQLFATHLPLRTTRTARRGQIVERRSPCFPGYLFVLLDLAATDDRWKQVNSTRAILRLLPSSERPIAIRTEEVLALHEAELDGALVSGMVTPGSRLRAYRGALANQVIQCIDCVDGMVSALLSCFGRETRVSIPVGNVTIL